MPDNVKQALAAALSRLLRPLIRVMLRQGLTYDEFAGISRTAFISCAAKDFADVNSASSTASISTLTGIPESELQPLLKSELLMAADGPSAPNHFAKVLHGWHNDRDYIGPYGFPIDLPFDGPAPSLSALVARHTPGIAAEVILRELIRMSAVREVGKNIWKPNVQEYIDPTLSPENIRRMGKLVESLLSTLENNTNVSRKRTDLFERTMVVDAPLSQDQLLAFQAYLKIVGGQFLQRVDTYAAIDLREKIAIAPGEVGSVRAGFQCFLFVEPDDDEKSH